MNGPVLIAYDGSEDARAAVEFAGTLLEGRDAIVLTVWEPLLLQVESAGVMAAFIPPTAVDIDADSEAAARQIAEEGAMLAGLAGIIATPRWEQEAPTIWATVDDVARELDATLIVSGTRGLSRVKSLVMGSVSDRLLHNAGRPTLVVPAARNNEDAAVGPEDGDGDDLPD